MKNRRMLGGLAFLVFLLVFPLLLSNPAVTSVAVFTLLAAGSATAWNIFSGYTGYISLGYAAFYGLGAYALAILCAVWHIPGGFGPFLLLPIVGGITGICAIPLGRVALKTRRFAFMVITIAIYSLTAQLPNLLTGLSANMGEISLPIPLWSGDTFNLPFYYAALLVLLLALATSWWVRSSKYGLSLLAIRDDEDRAWGLGVKTGSYKLAAFVVSAIFAGMTGAINVYFLSFISPLTAFDRAFNIAIPLMAFLGGVGTLTGPVIGALLAVPLQQYITIQFGEQGWDLILYGVLFLVILLALPQGIVPTLQKLWSRRVSTHEIEKMTAEEVLQPASNNQPIAPAWNAAPGISAIPVTPAIPATSVPSIALAIPAIPVTPVPSVTAITPIPAAAAPTSRGKMTQGTFHERLVAITSSSLSAASEQEGAGEDEDEDTQKRPTIAARHGRAAHITRATHSVTPIPVSSIPSMLLAPPVQLPFNEEMTITSLREVNAQNAQPAANPMQMPITPQPVFNEQPAKQPISGEMTQTQRVRATRLVGMSQRQRSMPPASTRRPAAPPRHCPRCQQTLSVWGATYFCTRCGLTLSQSSASARPQHTTTWDNETRMP